MFDEVDILRETEKAYFIKMPRDCIYNDYAFWVSKEYVFDYCEVFEINQRGKKVLFFPTWFEKFKLIKHTNENSLLDKKQVVIDRLQFQGHLGVF
ncbi:MAG: hypothetical protein ACK5LZ_06140 [Anaerorhabdus sp.]